MISPESKFVGEALEQKDVRTVFVSAMEDDKERENRVILLLGSASSQKSDLIDFFCNYFYGIDANNQRRYHISDEKFNSETPQKLVQCYIFNETVMQVRPVILDVIGCGDSYDGYDTPSTINKWLLNNWKMRIDSIAVVFSDLHRMSMHEEDELQQVLQNLPEHVLDNIVVFITASDGSRTFEPLLRRFGLSHCPKFTINTSCIFQKQIEDRLNDEHRKRYWRMSVNQFNEFFKGVQEATPVTISGLPYVDDGIYGVNESAGGGSSRSSMYSSSKSTVIEVEQHATSQTSQQTIVRPTSSPPLPPPPPVSNKPIPPPPPPKPTFNPPPIPASPPPKLPTNEPQGVGIPLYSEKHLSSGGQQTLTPPRPPSFAPPVPPAALITDTSATNALTNAMFEQMKHQQQQASVQYDYATYGNERPYSSQTPYYAEPPESQSGLIENRRHSVPDDIRHYADETTPPPVLHDVVDRYSTVAYMNHGPNQYATQINSPIRNQVGVRDAHRLSRDDLRIVDATSSPSDSQSDELRRMYSGRSGNSVKPTGDVTARYVYDTANRNYTAYGERQARQSYTSIVNNDRKRWSRSSEPRSETYINDPYYSGKDVVTGYGVIETRRSRTSLHSHGSVPELIHSENKYDYTSHPEHQSRAMERRSRQDIENRSRRQSEGSRQIYIDRQISPERQRKDQYQNTNYTHVNMQDNPQYNIPRREVPPPPKPVPQAPQVHRVSGGEVYEDERSVYEAYSQIQHQRQNQNIGGGVQPQQQQYPQRYDQVPDQSQSNHYIIPKSMRGSQSPIQQLPQQYDSYGEPIYVQRQVVAPGVTEETTTTTTTTRNEEIERKRKKKKEEETVIIPVPPPPKPQPQPQPQPTNDNYNYYDQRDVEAALIEEEYNTRHLKRTVEHQQKNNQQDYDYRRDGRNGRGGYDAYNDYNKKSGGKSTGKSSGKSSSSTHVVTRRQHGFGWSPSNYRNPRDCFLNLLCFIIAPLVIILIIVVIIVFVIIQ